jgi:hypothetical protein
MVSLQLTRLLLCVRNHLQDVYVEPFSGFQRLRPVFKWGSGSKNLLPSLCQHDLGLFVRHHEQLFLFMKKIKGFFH